MITRRAYFVSKNAGRYVPKKFNKGSGNSVPLLPKPADSIQNITSFTDVLPSISTLDTQSIDELRWAILANHLTEYAVALPDAIKIVQKLKDATLKYGTSIMKDEASGAILDMLGSGWTTERILAIADQNFLGIVLAYAMESMHTISDKVASEEVELLSDKFHSEGFKETAAQLMESIPSTLDESSPYFAQLGNENGFVNVALIRRKGDDGNEYFDIHVVDDINGEDCEIVSTQNCDQQQVEEALMGVFISTVTKAYSKAGKETR